MNKEIIERYIQFAIDNGFLEKKLGEKYEKVIDLDIGKTNTFINVLIRNGFTASDTFNNIEMITSGEFIEVVCNWKNNKENKFKNLSRGFKLDLFTSEQALAIRDNKLEEFIINILNIGTDKKK